MSHLHGLCLHDFFLNSLFLFDIRCRDKLVCEEIPGTPRGPPTLENEVSNTEPHEKQAAAVLEEISETTPESNPGSLEKMASAAPVITSERLADSIPVTEKNSPIKETPPVEEPGESTNQSSERTNSPECGITTQKAPETTTTTPPTYKEKLQKAVYRKLLGLKALVIITG